MPAAGFLIIMGLGVEFVPFLTWEFKMIILRSLILPFTIVFPIIWLVMLRLIKTVSSFHLTERTERIPVFIGTLIFYIFLYLVARFIVVRLPTIYFSMMLGGIISVLLATLITFRWKISIHAIGISGVLGTLFATGEHISAYFFMLNENPVFWPIVVLVLIAGLVSTARLALNAHTPSQIYCGLLVGFCCLYFPVKFLLVI